MTSTNGYSERLNDFRSSVLSLELTPISSFGTNRVPVISHERVNPCTCMSNNRCHNTNCHQSPWTVHKCCKILQTAFRTVYCVTRWLTDSFATRVGKQKISASPFLLVVERVKSMLAVVLSSAGAETSNTRSLLCKAISFIIYIEKFLTAFLPTLTPCTFFRKTTRIKNHHRYYSTILQ